MNIYSIFSHLDWDLGCGCEASTPSWHLLARLHSNPWLLAASGMSWARLVHTSSHVFLVEYNRVQHLQSTTILRICLCLYITIICIHDNTAKTRIQSLPQNKLVEDWKSWFGETVVVSLCHSSLVLVWHTLGMIDDDCAKAQGPNRWVNKW